MPVKIDFKKKLKHLYNPSATEVVFVEVPEMQFVMIDGQGDPNKSQEYMDTFPALYPVSYQLKFMSKAQGKDYVVPPPEGLWWADEMTDFLEGRKDKWKWTMMMMLPDFITKDMFEEVIKLIKEKKSDLPPGFSKLRFETYHEGKAAQILYIGPYADEHPTIIKIHKFIEAQGGTFDGHKQKHHEIYLSDPRRTKPERFKTVIRQPFK